MKNKSIFNISLIFSLFITIVVLFLISRVKDVLDLETINRLFYYENEWFVAENSEKMMYLVGLVLGPSSFLIFYILLRKYLNVETSSFIQFLLSNVFITGVTLFLLMYVLSGNSYVNSLCAILQESKGSIVYFAFVFVILYFVFKKIKKIEIKVINISLVCISVLLALSVSVIYIKTNFFFGNSIDAHHFEAIYYPMFYVFNNLDIGIDFTNLYGLYPYFLLPIFKLLGGVTVFKFTLVQSIMSFIVLILVLIFLYKFIKNKYIAFLSFTTFLMYYIYAFSAFNVGYYYQYLPHRIFFPICVFYICYKILTCKKEKQKYFKILGYIISGISLFYNLDSGVVTVISYLGFNLYQNALNYSFKDKKIYIESLKNIVNLIIYCIIPFVFIELLIFIRSGSFINPSSLLFGQTTFCKLGFFMLKMPLIHPWILLVITYLYYLCLSITKFKSFDKENNNNERIKYSLLFLLSLLGFGLFSYYQGRSHDNTFISVTWPIILILGIILDDVINNRDSYYRFNYITKQIIIVMFFSIYSSILAFDLLFNTRITKLYKINNNEYLDLFNVDYIKDIHDEEISKYDKVNMILDYTSLYYSHYNLNEVPRIDNPVDWLYSKEKINNVLDYILNHKNEVFIISDNKYYYLKYNEEKLKELEKNFRFEVYQTMFSADNMTAEFVSSSKRFYVLMPINN